MPRRHTKSECLVSNRSANAHLQNGITENGAMAAREPVEIHTDSTRRFGCFAPTGCVVGEPVDADEPDDAVKVICNNPDCDQGQFMHKVCFEAWEDSILHQLKTSGRTRGWSEKQRVQNLWSKKGYDMAYKACACRCGKGHLQKDLQYFAPNSEENNNKTHFRRKSGGSRQLPSIGRPNPQYMNQKQQQMRDRAQSLGSAVAFSNRQRSSNSESAYAAGVLIGADGAPLANGKKTCSKNQIPEDDFYSKQVHTKTGNIFERRENFTDLLKIIPRWKLNGYQVKMEDDCPQGNDDTRCLILTALGDHKMTEVMCLLCHNSMLVYDRYPLIDGTFFISPVNHGNMGILVKHDHHERFLNALCVRCLEFSSRVKCKKCGTSGWFRGDCLQLGTLYTYDILAAFLCCPSSCGKCAAQFALEVWANRPYSCFSQPLPCGECGHMDSHFIRPIEQIELASV